MADQSRRIPDQRAATLEEVHAAVSALSVTDLLRLKKYAEARFRMIGRAAMGSSYEDLLQEAVSLTLGGRRRWNKQAVDFLGHLTGVIRSISSHLAERFDPAEAELETEMISINDEGVTRSPIENAPSELANPEQNLAAKDEIEKIKALFANDTVAIQVIEGWQLGQTLNEIEKARDISKHECEAAVRRIRRALRIGERRGDNHA